MEPGAHAIVAGRGEAALEGLQRALDHRLHALLYAHWRAQYPRTTRAELLVNLANFYTFG